jgi:hypothetical protein
MGMTMTATPPMPPEVQGQMQQQSVAPMFQQMGANSPSAGGGIPDPVSVLEAQIAKLEQWASETAPLTNQINPALSSLLVPIAQAGKALQQEIASLRQRTAQPSPPVTGSMPPNVPGNIPGARPAM